MPPAGMPQVHECFYSIWERDSLCNTILAAAAARGRKLTVYTRRLLRPTAPSKRAGTPTRLAAASANNQADVHV